MCFASGRALLVSCHVRACLLLTLVVPIGVTDLSLNLTEAFGGAMLLWGHNGLVCPVANGRQLKSRTNGAYCNNSHTRRDMDWANIGLAGCVSHPSVTQHQSINQASWLSTQGCVAGGVPCRHQCHGRGPQGRKFK